MAGISNNDLYAVKYDSSGIKKGQARYSQRSSSQESFSDLEVAEVTGTVYVAGWYYNTAQNSDYLVLKYSVITGVKRSVSEIPTEFSLGQNYPNPFNPSTTIHRLQWDAHGLSSGAYFYRLRANDYMETKRLTFMQ